MQRAKKFAKSYALRSQTEKSAEPANADRSESWQPGQPIQIAYRLRFLTLACFV